MDYEEKNKENEPNERKEFYNRINEDENIKKQKKVMKYNVITLMLTMVLVINMFVLGIYYKVEFLYIIAIVIGLLYILVYYSKEYSVKVNVIDQTKYYIKDFLQKKYTIENISEEKIEDIVDDNNNFILEDPLLRKICFLEISIDTHFIRFKKNNEFVDLFEYEDYNPKKMNFVLVTKVVENKMLFLKTIYDDSIFGQKNKNIFEKRISDSKDYINNILRKNDNKKSEEYINLTEEQKSKLVSIYNKYNVHFEIMIKSGKLFIIIKNSFYNYIKSIERVYDIENCLDELLDVFIDM